MRYFAASALALCVDMGLLLALAKHLHYLVAACMAFTVGTAVHYVLAVKLVFKTRRLRHFTHAEGMVFFLAGVGGLLLNALIISVSVEWLATPLSLAKLLAAGGSFVAGYITRKTLLFS